MVHIVTIHKGCGCGLHFFQNVWRWTHILVQKWISKLFSRWHGSTNFVKKIYEQILWNPFGHDFCGIHIFFFENLISHDVHVPTFGKDNYCASNITIPKCIFFDIVKIHCKNVPLNIPHVFFSGPLIMFLP